MTEFRPIDVAGFATIQVIAQAELRATLANAVRAYQQGGAQA